MLNNRSTRRKITRNRSFRDTDHFTLSPETKRGIAIVVLFSVSFIMLLSYFQATGIVGLHLTRLLGKAFGWGDWVVPLLLLLLSYFLMRPSQYDVKIINYVGLVMTMLGYSGLLHLVVREKPLADIIADGAGGGYLGYAIGNPLYQATEFWGALIILLSVFCIGIFIFLNTSFANLSLTFQNISLFAQSWWPVRKPRQPEAPVYDQAFRTEPIAESDEDDGTMTVAEEEEPVFSRKLEPQPRKQTPPRRVVHQKIDLPLELLTSSNEVPAGGDIKATMNKIETALKSFGIEVTMGEVNVGPTVTQYTLKPTEGVKLNQITALQNDLALALAAHPIRIEAPIPGKSLVGIEVPNQAVSIVKLKEVLQSNTYANRKSNLMVALGKDVSGKVIMADLDKMPHLLIAGATGSGKSVCINSILVSLLYQNSPELLKIILVDPKRVELSSYDGIPHLLAPVIIDIEKTINALKWTVQEMDHRYKMLSAAGKRNIAAYNDARLMEKMPYIIIIIDELADLMMVAAKEVESAIIRLAQMSRAVGIHLVLATQRPSVNVITGLIKANITSRIAFSVASATDSRTIIDSSGADKLLGNGDMLYISAELSKPKRIQGAFIGDQEITAVTDYLKQHGEPQYEASVTERRHGLVGGSSSGSSGSFEPGAEEQDVRLAAEAVIRAKRASATLLQSRLRMGFAKASRMLDILEERGVIGPQNSSRPRDVLMTRQEFEQQFGGFSEEGAEETLPFPEDSEPEQEDVSEASSDDETSEG